MAKSAFQPPPSQDELNASERKIRANDPTFNAQFQYANNFIRTYKYSFATFLPLNLFEQFQRLANFYFICLLILQLIPIISSLTPITTAVPLFFVLSLTAVKDAYDDYQRHTSDSEVNNRKADVLRNGKRTTEIWSNVQVGDIVRLHNDEFITADLQLLSTSEPNGLAFIETAELDGETNLKCRQCLTETASMLDDEEQLGKFEGEIVCELPNNHLNKFDGTLLWKGQKYPIDNDKILLRGCVLRNTKWCYGIVIFAGRDTKLMMNSGKSKFKRTSIDRLMNMLIIGIVFFLLFLCLFCTIACGVWETVTGQYYQEYLPWEELVPESSVGGATVIAVLIFLSYVIAMNTLVPISLYVSVEVIRLAQSFLINWDSTMVYKGTSAMARTTTLNEELGQIEYIFSDKTGTLTQNIMEFNKCSINSLNYGDVVDPVTMETLVVDEHTKHVDFSANPYYEESFRFYDQKLQDEIQGGNAMCQEFFRLLALCHTVMPETKDGKLIYQAQSPDEGALVSAARNFGFVFQSRTPHSVTITELGKEETYELLCILDFNNVRKRMSVILKKNNRITLYCKGADSIIYERLRQGDTDLKEKTQEHLNNFAGEGLRTLCLAVKHLDTNYFNDWKTRHHEAATSIDNRDEKLDAIYEEIERDLELIGASAIEDKLQDGVPQAIANLALAGIKIWVLTGDKQETAINIGYSCELLTDDMQEVFIVDANTHSDVESQLRKHLQTQRHTKEPRSKLSVSVVTFGSENELRDIPSRRGEYAIVINGHSLVYALHPKMEELFLEVAASCKAVICCRVTPLQKAMVVDLVKRYKKAVTLAIGDGANDVSMIKTAHIGVGISGQEGLQAVLNSDYSIAQFRYLERLLLVHGRWSYLRMCKFLRYFFYKNFSFTLCHFWFAFFCGFSAQALYDPFFISCYNLFYTSMPVVCLAIFDQDVGAGYCIQFPNLYFPGIANLYFNKAEFAKSAGVGFLTSCVLFFIPYATYNNAITSTGLEESDHTLFGYAVATILVIIVTVQIAIDTSYWTPVNAFFIVGSIIIYFALTFSYFYIVIAPYVGSLSMLLSGASFWFSMMLATVLCILPVILKRFYMSDIHPTLADKVRLKQRMDKRRTRPAAVRTSSAMRRSRRSLRSSYAFSHQEGFGRLITSGKMMRTPIRSESSSNSLAPKHSKNSLFTKTSSRENLSPSSVLV